jgi:hypothetical protein
MIKAMKFNPLHRTSQLAYLRTYVQYKRFGFNLRVKSKSTELTKGVKQSRKCERQDTGPEKAGRHGPSHADFAMGQGEDFR